MTAGAVYAANQHCLKHVLRSGFVHGQLNDVLAMFAMLCYCNTIAFKLPCRRSLFVDPRGVVVFSLVCGCFWECITPLYKPTSVSDPWDLVACLCGGLGYSLIYSVWDRRPGAQE